MKKKVIAVVLLLCATLLVLTACSSPKEFSVSGMTITLTSQFVEKDVVGQTKCYQSLRVIVTALKESFSTLGVSQSFTLQEYTKAVLAANKITATIKTGEKYYSFTYEKNVEGQDYYYFATTHKSGDAFWLIQFACFKSDKETYQPTFEKWADSVVFDA